MEDNARPVLATHGFTVWKLPRPHRNGHQYYATKDDHDGRPMHFTRTMGDMVQYLDHQSGSLYTFPHGDYVRAATPDEAHLAFVAGRDGIPGVFTLNGHRYYVTKEHEL